MNNLKLMLKRGLALWIDLVFSALIGILLYFHYSTTYIVEPLPFVMALGVLVLMGRDIFGRSLGKCICRLKIVDIKTNSPAKCYQRILRNIAAPIIAIEALILCLKNDDRRLGDMLAGTSVEEIKK